VLIVLHAAFTCAPIYAVVQVGIDRPLDVVEYCVPFTHKNVLVLLNSPETMYRLFKVMPDDTPAVYVWFSLKKKAFALCIVN